MEWSEWHYVFLGITFNHFPKNHLIWRASVRLPEMLRKIMIVYRAVQDCALVRLHAEDQVFVFSRGETRRALLCPTSGVLASFQTNDGLYNSASACGNLQCLPSISSPKSTRSR